MVFSKKDKLFRLFAVVFCLAIILSTSTAFAATTLMTYDGTGIRSKASIESFELTGSTKITVDHYTTAVKYNGDQPASNAELYVNLQRKGTVFYSDTGDNIITHGIQHKTKSWTKSEGTYRLYFSTTSLSETYWPGVDINGTVSK